MLKWKPCNDIELDNLKGKHSHLYRKVLNSNQIKAATERVPDISEFPEEAGFRDHVLDCMGIYEQLRKDPNRIIP